jgi:hypothetical protein
MNTIASKPEPSSSVIDVAEGDDSRAACGVSAGKFAFARGVFEEGSRARSAQQA